MSDEVEIPICWTVDFETKPIAPRPDYPPTPIGVAIRSPEGDSSYMSWGHPTGNNCTLKQAKKKLAEVWASKYPKLFYNAKFDVAVATEKMGLPELEWEDIHDAMFLAFLADPHCRDLRLKALCDDLLGWPPEEQDAVDDYVWENRKRLKAEYGKNISRSKGKVSSLGAWFHAVPAEILAPYAIGDIDRTWELFEHLYEVVCLNGMAEAYDIERQVLPIFMENERDGIRIDIKRLKKDIPAYQRSLRRADKLLGVMLGVPGLNIDADEQLAEALTNAEIIADGDWVLTAKAKKKSVSKENLPYEVFRDEEVAHLYFYRNKLQTSLSTFLLSWEEQAEANDGYIFTNWNQVRGGSGGTRCVPKGELVQTSKGYLPVQDVRVGDYVLSHTGEARKVTECTSHAPAPIVLVKTTNGLTLRTTEAHKYMTARGWVRAIDLEITDEVLVASDAEVWRGCPDWQEFSVSSWGRVRYEKTGTIRKLSKKNKWGHLKIMMARNGERERGLDRKDFSVHRLVARAFNVGGVGEEVRHLNGIAWDNTVENLRWGTAQENREDAKQHGTLWMRRYGETILTEEAVEDIRSTSCVSRIMAEKYGVDASYIRAIRRGERWPDLDGLPPRPNSFRLVGLEGVAIVKEAPTFGLTVEIDHSHVTGGIVTHNTGRPSTSGNNFLNIPKEFDGQFDMEKGNEYALAPLPFPRDYILPDEGEVFLHRDFDGQEMRIFAHFSCGPLLAAYQEDPTTDPHEMVGMETARLQKRKYDKKKDRGSNKILNFQALYGGGIPAAAKKLKCSPAKAKEYKAFHDKALPERVWLNETIKELIAEGEPMRTWGGRCYFVEESRVVEGQMRHYDYKMINYLCQGSAADVTKKAMVVWYYHPKRDARFLVTVYDEINVSCRPEIEEEQMALLKACMESVKLDLEMRTSGKRGDRWGNLEETV